MFFELIRKAREKNVNTNKLIEKPTITGETCFRIASYMSKRISKYILTEDIEVDFISKQFQLPWYEHEELTEQMLLKNINPYINYNGKNQLDRYPGRFENVTAILNRFQKAAFFVTKDTKCNERCSSKCGSDFQRFKCYPGSLVETISENFIGSGAFGKVYKGKWHGEECAMKFIPIKNSELRDDAKSIKRDLDLQSKLKSLKMRKADEGIVLRIGMVRQQNQYFQTDTNRWVEINYQINIFPKYDCDLYQLHEDKFKHFNDNVIENILHQCLRRK